MAGNSRSTPAFRREAVQLALSSDRSRKEVAEELGIGASTLARWIRDERVRDEPATDQSAVLSALSVKLVEGSDFVHYCDALSGPYSVGKNLVHSAQADAEGAVAFVRLADGVPNARSGGRTDGYSLRTPDSFEAAASGQRISVSVIARAAEAPKARFALAYSTNEVGNSRWRWQEAGPDWAVHSFEYQVPVMKQGRGDFIGILPGPDGEPGVDLFLVAVRTLLKE